MKRTCFICEHKFKEDQIKEICIVENKFLTWMDYVCLNCRKTIPDNIYIIADSNRNKYE